MLLFAVLWALTNPRTQSKTDCNYSIFTCALFDSVTIYNLGKNSHFGGLEIQVVNSFLSVSRTTNEAKIFLLVAVIISCVDNLNTFVQICTISSNLP